MREKKSNKKGLKKPPQRAKVIKKVTRKKTTKKLTKEEKGLKKKTPKKKTSLKKAKELKSTLKKKVTKKTTKKEIKKVRIEKPFKKVETETKEISKKTYPDFPTEVLPEEYGEDAITLMTVDPRKLFIYWEVSKDSILLYKGDVALRLYDVTGVDFDGKNANSYIDLTIYKRIGDLYMEVQPEREYIADIGVKDHTGTFITIARSNKASTPPAGKAEKGVFHPRIYKVGIPVKEIKIGY
jgi:hypothetical protein